MNSPVNNINISQVECPPPPKKSWRKRLTTKRKTKKKEEPPTCPICMECMSGGKVTTKCKHDICIGCYTTLVRSKYEMPSCPMCRQNMADDIRDIKPPEAEPHPNEWMNEWNAAITSLLSEESLHKISRVMKIWELSDFEDMLDDACDEISPKVTHREVVQAVCNYTKSYIDTAFGGEQINQGDWDHIKYEIGVIYTNRFLKYLSCWNGDTVKEAFLRFQFRPDFVRPTVKSLQDYPAYMTEPDERLTPAEVTQREFYHNDIIQNQPKEMIDYYDSGITALFEEDELERVVIYRDTQSVLNNIQCMEENLNLGSLFPEEYHMRDDTLEDGEIDTDDDTDDDMPELETASELDSDESMPELEAVSDLDSDETDEQEPNSITDNRIGSELINWEPNQSLNPLEFQELLNILVTRNTNASE